ncbi:EPIDERMAL PATTERNING FACTOR-like protein 5 [Mercurialis annua]|uniref:EPIDERMAL PATTERNING FACTOR-like protein 5 n=1 Tax=Mercurialis annua TaxID=3986 RepID=UPI00215FAA4B|nr:EPIDERMAL PATTERNING FACTOR-like protein 5 [Mercurialis annua]
MEKRKSNVTLIISLCFIIISHCLLVHSRELAQYSHSPSPAPAMVIGKGRNGRAKGSYPAKCHLKCNQCKPCMPIEVSIRSMELQEKDYYYPQVWKCLCGDYIFSP